jgi:hypothetical protein
MHDTRRLVIAGKTGRVYHAIQHPNLRKTRPCFCFVPDEFIEGKVFDKNRYLASRWPSANCTANPNGIGSHAMPDLGKPVSPKSRCPILREFLRQLETVAKIKITP